MPDSMNSSRNTLPFGRKGPFGCDKPMVLKICCPTDMRASAAVISLHLEASLAGRLRIRYRWSHIIRLHRVAICPEDLLFLLALLAARKLLHIPLFALLFLLAFIES
jgi:hypothetical protein